MTILQRPENQPASSPKPAPVPVTDWQAEAIKWKDIAKKMYEAARDEFPFNNGLKSIIKIWMTEQGIKLEEDRA